MNITVNCTYDKKAVTAFARSGLYKKADPRKCFITFIAIVLFYIIGATIIAVVGGNDSKALILIALAALILFFQFYIYLILPRIIFNARKNLGNVRQTLTFTDDEIISLSSSDELESTEKISYNIPVSEHSRNQKLCLCLHHKAVGIYNRQIRYFRFRPYRSSQAVCSQIR